jgi:hypothetical protein
MIGLQYMANSLRLGSDAACCQLSAVSCQSQPEVAG